MMIQVEATMALPIVVAGGAPDTVRRGSESGTYVPFQQATPPAGSRTDAEAASLYWMVQYLGSWKG